MYVKWRYKTKLLISNVVFCLSLLMLRNALVGYKIVLIRETLSNYLIFLPWSEGHRKETFRGILGLNVNIFNVLLDNNLAKFWNIHYRFFSKWTLHCLYYNLLPILVNHRHSMVLLKIPLPSREKMLQTILIHVI